MGGFRGFHGEGHEGFGHEHFHEHFHGHFHDRDDFFCCGFGFGFGLGLLSAYPWYYDDYDYPYYYSGPSDYAAPVTPQACGQWVWDAQQSRYYWAAGACPPEG
jgi:hypothetical protein